MEGCSLSRQCGRLPHRTPRVTPRVGPQPGPSRQGLPSKPNCWVCLNQPPQYKEITRKTLQKQFSYPVTLNPTLDGFKLCLNIYASFSIAAAAHLDFTAKFGLEKSLWTIFLSPRPAAARYHKACDSRPGAGHIPPRRSHHLTQEVFIAEDGVHRIIKLKHRETPPWHRRFAARCPWVVAPRHVLHLQEPGGPRQLPHSRHQHLPLQSQAQKVPPAALRRPHLLTAPCFLDADGERARPVWGEGKQLGAEPLAACGSILPAPGGFGMSTLRQTLPQLRFSSPAWLGAAHLPPSPVGSCSSQCQ